MGRKQPRPRKQIYLYVTTLVVSCLAFWGCATLKTWSIRRDARKHLVEAGELLAQQDYKASLDENQKVLTIQGSFYADEALFNIALIYADPRNPERDYEKSLEFFKRLLTDYPKSPMVEQSRIWSLTLSEILSHGRKITELRHEVMSREEVIRDLEGQLERLNERLERLKQVDIQLERRRRGKN
jgi:tetratricopeptide (TPR) repeat protein